MTVAGSMRKYRKRFRPKFENGGFWEYYIDLERQLEDFLGYVPYLDKNEQVCSFRLVNLFLSIGGHIDSALKEMALYRGFSRNQECQEIKRKVLETRIRIRTNKPPIIIKIQELLNPFENEYKLSQKKVVFKRLPEREEIMPFCPHNPVTKAPKWWEIYNGLKHDFTDNFEHANLRNTLHALSGAFLLNVIHGPAILRLNDYDLLEWPGGGMPREQLIDMIYRKQKLFCSVETPLFVYDYEQRGEKP